MSETNNYIIILGCGSSSGCPVINCDCKVCTSKQIKNIRTRTSAYLEIDNTSILIDTGTDFRMQALANKIPKIDAVLYTHFHSDHVNGIDDLRAFCFKQKAAIDVYGNLETINNLTSRFEYAFLEANNHWNRPVLKANIITEEKIFISDIAISTYNLPHGRFTTSIYHIGDVVWATDISQLSKDVIKKIQGVRHLFIDCLNYDKYPTHLNFQEALNYAKMIKAENTYLIHLTHGLDYYKLSGLCPQGVYVGYDGLKINLVKKEE